jgi:arabinogalactan endo-1,4-beta-galactosidase
LSANLDDLAARYEKPLVIVETAYPWTLQRLEPAMVVTSPAQLPDAGSYPATKSGQAAYFAGLRDVLTKVPGSRGVGLFAWEPEWISGVGATPGGGNPHANLAMFDDQGRGLPSLQVAFRAPP